MSEVAEHLEAIYTRLAHMEGIIDRMHRHGTVTDVDYSDANKPRVRVQVAAKSDGTPVKGPWVPVASFAGERAVHHPLTVGQQVTQISPDGNYENGYVIPLGFSSKIPSPSTDAAEHKDVYGSVTESLKKEQHYVKLGEDCDHVIQDGKQRITVSDITKLIIKFNNTCWSINPSALIPAEDLTLK